MESGLITQTTLIRTGAKRGYRHLDVLSQQAGQRKGDQRPLRVEGRPTNPGLRAHASHPMPAWPSGAGSGF
jgi:hypothetical protein